MKRILSTIAAAVLAAALIIQMSGCSVTVRIYGKSIDALSDIDLGYGRVYLSQVMNALTTDDLQTVNDLGYHAGLEDAETFEELFDTYHELKESYGEPVSIYLYEGVQYGDEKAYTGEMEMEKGGTLMLSLLFTSKDELALAYLYETEKGFWSHQSMPEGVITEDVILGEGTEHPLNAQITYPANASEGCPAIVMVGGDGGNDMNMKAVSTRSYQDLAWGLAEQGIVTIRFDKRTYTYSDEESAEAAPKEVFTVDWEYAEDTLLALRKLQEKSFVDSEKIYFLGHSQGGVVGSRIQEKALSEGLQGFAGFVLVNTSPRPWYDVIYDQYINYGLIDRQSDEIYYLVQKMEMERDYVKEGDYLKTPDEKLTQEFALTRPAAFWRDYLSYDYVDGYRKLAEGGSRILLMQGGADYQIVPSTDFEAWKETVSGWNTDTVSFYLAEGLNHLMTPSQGIFAGHYKEYEMPGRVPESVIEQIAAFVR